MKTRLMPFYMNITKNLEEKNKFPEKNDTILLDSFVPEFTHDKISPYFGLALDIGTTTLNMNLISLKNTKILAKAMDITSGELSVSM